MKTMIKQRPVQYAAEYLGWSADENMSEDDVREYFSRENLERMFGPGSCDDLDDADLGSIAQACIDAMA